MDTAPSLPSIYRLEVEPDPAAQEQARLEQQARTGDAHALALLIQQYRPRVYAFALGQMLNAEDAEDATQETFVRAVRQIRTFRCEAQFRTWLYSIATNVCRDHQRRNGRERNRRMLAGAETGTTGDVQETVALEVALTAAVTRLPAKYREVITLYWLEQLSPAEIAEVLQRPVGRVRVQLWRARMQLAQELREGLD